MKQFAVSYIAALSLNTYQLCITQEEEILQLYLEVRDRIHYQRTVEFQNQTLKHILHLADSVQSLPK